MYRGFARAGVVAAYVLVFWALLPALLLLPIALWPVRWPAVPASAVGGGFLILAGTSLMAAATAELVRRGRGLPISHLPPKSLVKSGSYCFSRHPLYAGYLALLVGAALLLRSPAMLVISVPVFIAGAAVYTAFEERSLTARYGEAYRLYRTEVPRLFPSPVILADWPARAACAAFFRLRRSFHGTDLAGGFVLVCPHNNYLDPLFLYLAVRSPIHFLVTHDMYRSPRVTALFDRLGAIRVDRYRPQPSALLGARRIVESGGIVGVFPEGGRSWYGEGCYSRQLARFLVRSGLDVVTARIEGAYAAWPRWRGPRAWPVRVEFLRRTKVSSEPAFHDLLAEARFPAGNGVGRGDRPGSPAFAPTDQGGGLSAPRYARAAGLERIAYLCPGCGAIEPFRVNGSAASCRACGVVYRLLDDLRVETDQRTLSLPELHAQILERLSRVGRIRGDVEWVTERGQRRYDVRRGSAVLEASGEGLVVEGAYARVSISTGDVDGVVIRGNRRLQVYARGALETFTFHGPGALMFQDFLRLHAFGDVFRKHRRQRMVPLLPP